LARVGKPNGINAAEECPEKKKERETEREKERDRQITEEPGKSRIGDQIRESL